MIIFLPTKQNFRLDSLPADLRQVDNNEENIIDHQQQQQQKQDPNGTQMVTFLPPKNNKNHNQSGGGGGSDNHQQQQQHHTLPKRFPTPPPSVSMSAVDIHDYRHDNDINELSEYCEPNH